jgi:hypothetical protein
MNRKTDQEELLDDVLAEATTAEFREALLGETLRLAGRRRRFRRARNAAGILAAIALAGILAWHRNPATREVFVAPHAPKAIEKNYIAVDTRPLPTDAIITSHPLSSAQFVASKNEIVIVQTTTGNFRIINDEELLALVAAHPAVLVRAGPNSEKLIFANPQDAKDFLAN